MSLTFGKYYLNGTEFWTGAADLLGQALLHAIRQPRITVVVLVHSCVGINDVVINIRASHKINRLLTHQSESDISTEVTEAIRHIRTGESHLPPMPPQKTPISATQQWNDTIPSAHERIAFADKLKAVNLDPRLVERIEARIVMR